MRFKQRTNKTVYFTKGLPGSGKTTETVVFTATHNKSSIHLNKDTLRLFLKKLQHTVLVEESLVVQLERYLATQAMAREIDVIVIDNTHFNPAHEKFYSRLATQHGYDFVIVDFTDVPLEVCIERDEKRQVGHVGEKVIRDMYNKYLAKKPPTIAFDPSLPTAIICDLDGTLALMNGRSPYDTNKYDTDTLNTPVAELLQGMFSIPLWESPRLELIFMSGRKEAGRKATLEWLHKHFVGAFSNNFRALYMRKDDDNRKDAIVKRELYDEHVRGKYNVKFVLDDRNQVVEMWRGLGLTCFQVADGNF